MPERHATKPTPCPLHHTPHYLSLKKPLTKDALSLRHRYCALDLVAQRQWCWQLVHRFDPPSQLINVGYRVLVKAIRSSHEVTCQGEGFVFPFTIPRVEVRLKCRKAEVANFKRHFSEARSNGSIVLIMRTRCLTSANGVW